MLLLFGQQILQLLTKTSDTFISTNFMRTHISNVFIIYLLLTLNMKHRRPDVSNNSNEMLPQSSVFSPVNILRVQPDFRVNSYRNMSTHIVVHNLTGDYVHTYVWFSLADCLLMLHWYNPKIILYRCSHMLCVCVFKMFWFQSKSSYLWEQLAIDCIAYQYIKQLFT